MKLTELEPHWIGLHNWAHPNPFWTGVSFLCPHCPTTAPTHGPNRRRRLAVMFHPSIDPDNVALMFASPIPPQGHRRVSGETFENLTLSPSIGFDAIGHWHGNITNGEITP